MCYVFGDSRQKASAAPFPYMPGPGRKPRIPPASGKLDSQARSMNLQLSCGLGKWGSWCWDWSSPGTRSTLSRQLYLSAQVNNPTPGPTPVFSRRYLRHAFSLLREEGVGRGQG